jgi:hypothetical protein
VRKQYAQKRRRALAVDMVHVMQTLENVFVIRYGTVEHVTLKNVMVVQ